MSPFFHHHCLILHVSCMYITYMCPVVIVLSCFSHYFSFLKKKLTFFFCFSTSYTSAAYVANPNVLVRVGSVTSTSGTYATIRSVRKTAASMTEDDLPNGISGGVAGNKVSSHVSPYATSYVATAPGSNNYHVYSKPASPTPSKISYYACTPLVSIISAGTDLPKLSLSYLKSVIIIYT